MISILLAEKIIQLFIILFLGFGIVKCGALKSEDSYALSKLCLYLIMPLAILGAFQREYTPQIRAGLFLAVGVSVCMHLVMILVEKLCGRWLGMNEVERGSIMYSNAANLLIPIVSSVLGEEWVIYTCAYLAVQNIFAWTQGVSLFSGEIRLEWKKILLNPNILAVIAGILMFLLRIRIPELLQNTIDSVSVTLGPISMLIAGMLFAAADFKKVFGNVRIYLVLLFRMLLLPALFLVLMLVTGVRSWIPDGKEVLLVTFLAGCSPTAAMMTQFAQLFHRDAEYASSINILTTLSCVVTMPLFVYLYLYF